MNNVARVPSDYRIFSASTKRSWQKMMLRPEQKFSECIINILTEFYRSENLVLDTVSGMSLVAKVYLQLFQHRRLVGCERNSFCFHDALPSRTEVYDKQLFSPDLSTVGNSGNKVFFQG